MSDLRKAAEMALDYIRREGWTNPQGKEVWIALRQALAQAEQEPVAWLRPSGEIVVRTDYGGRLYYSEQNVYTAPPKKEWVGLTVEEIKNTYFTTRADYVDFAKAIEAKLKEKNT